MKEVVNIYGMTQEQVDADQKTREECKACRGRGTDYDETCVQCGGKGVTTEMGFYIETDD